MQKIGAIVIAFIPSFFAALIASFIIDELYQHDKCLQIHGLYTREYAVCKWEETYGRKMQEIEKRIEK